MRLIATNLFGRVHASISLMAGSGRGQMLAEMASSNDTAKAMAENEHASERTSIATAASQAQNLPQHTKSVSAPIPLPAGRSDSYPALGTKKLAADMLDNVALKEEGARPNSLRAAVSSSPAMHYLNGVRCPIFTQVLICSARRCLSAHFFTHCGLAFHCSAPCKQCMSSLFFVFSYSPDDSHLAFMRVLLSFEASGVHDMG